MISSQAKKKYSDLLLFLLLFGGGLFATINMNIRHGEVRAPGKIWSDAAHYYVYMPATFIYHWNVYRFPYKIEKRFEGFTLNSRTGKVEIKTTYGLAFLLLPFFLMAHYSALLFHFPSDGFSTYYQVFMMIGSVFYFALGLLLLKKFLNNYLSPRVSILTVLILTLITQVYFYGIHSVLMSHIYSFFLFCAFLFLLKKFLDHPDRPWFLYILLAADISLAVLVRPTNIIIILWMAFLDIRSWKEVWKRILFFLHPGRIALFVAIQFLVLVPQFMYWKYLSGHYIYYSYPGEVFYWFHPQIIKEWFSPLNGLLPYHPGYLLFVAGMMLMISRRKINGMFSLVFFLMVSYMISCWHCWYYGGSFGARPFTEFTAFMALPFGFLVAEVLRFKNLFVSSVLVFLTGILIYFNMTQTYDVNIFTGGTWSWDDYFIHMKRYELVNFPVRKYTYKNDFQAVGMQGSFPGTNRHVRSRVLATYCDSGILYNPYLSWQLDKVLYHPVEKIKAELWVYPDLDGRTGARLLMRIDNAGKVIFVRTVNIDDFIIKNGEWSKVTAGLSIPEWVDPGATFTFYVYNAGKKKFFMDDLQIDFE